jgi:hypothetical protein
LRFDDGSNAEPALGGDYVLSTASIAVWLGLDEIGGNIGRRATWIFVLRRKLLKETNELKALFITKHTHRLSDVVQVRRIDLVEQFFAGRCKPYINHAAIFGITIANNQADSLQVVNYNRDVATGL